MYLKKEELIHIYLSICVFTCICVCSTARVCVCLYLPTCMCVCVCVHAHISLILIYWDLASHLHLKHHPCLICIENWILFDIFIIIVDNPYKKVIIVDNYTVELHGHIKCMY